VSALSDAVFSPVSEPPKKPKLTPKVPPKGNTPAVATTPAAATLLGPRAGTPIPVPTAPSLSIGTQLAAKPHTTGDPITDRLAKNNPSIAKLRAPVNDLLGKASDVFETPFDILGALAQDTQEGRPDSDPNSAQNRLRAQLQHGDFGGARTHSFTSWDTVKKLAADGNPIAKAALAHPRTASIAMGASEFLNPSNLLAGEAIGLAGRVLKAGTTAAGRAVGAAARRIDPDAVRSPVYRTTQSLGETLGGSRMGPVRQAAADQVKAQGGNAAAQKLAADRADIAGRRMTQATETATAPAQQLVKDVFGGLAPEQHADVIDAIEGTLDKDKMTPDIAKRVAAYRAFRGATDTRTITNGLAEPGELWQGATYFPRRGMTADPSIETSEEQNLADEIEARRSRGGTNVRRDTLNENIPARKYATRKQVVFNGVKLNPDWSAPDALLQHAVARGRNNILEEGAHDLQDLGLGVPLETPDMWGKPVPHRSDFLPFTQLGTVRQFGSPLFKGSAVHPSVADLVEDLGSQTSSGGLASAADIPGAILGGVNNAASRLTVANPAYHIPVNVLPNIGATALTHGIDPIAVVKALANPKAAIADAQAAGADFPFASRGFDPEDLQPWSSLDPKAKAIRVLRAPGRAVDAVSTGALYKHMQPPIAAAAFKGFEKPMGREAAALKTRQIVGEPENLSARERALGNTLMFPGWLKSQLRLWGPMLAKNPALYQSAHVAVNNMNESKGVGPSDYGWGSLLPPIVLSRDPKTGKTVELQMPSPANRLLGLTDAAVNIGNNPMQAATQIQNVLNPALGTGARVLRTLSAEPQEPSTNILWDKDAPTSVQRAQGAKAILGRYSPARLPEGDEQPSAAGLALSSVGIDPETKLSPQDAKNAFKVERLFREGRGGMIGIETMRSLAKKASSAGHPQRAAAISAMADAQYYLMKDATAAIGEPKASAKRLEIRKDWAAHLQAYAAAQKALQAIGAR
jgi:hypothetical protein